jgi:hypothetical protein
MRNAVRLLTRARRLYCPEAVALFAASSVQPSAQRMALEDATMRALVSTGIFAQSDRIFVHAAHDEQASRLNWKNPSGPPALPVNSPTFQADRGWTGDGAASRLRTQYTPSIDGVQFTLDNAAIWAWVTTDIAQAAAVNGNNTAPSSRIVPRSATDTLQVRVNDGTNTAGVSTSSIGFFGGQRRATTDKRMWKNGVQVGATLATASTALANAEQWICGGNAAGFSTGQVAAAAWTAALTGLEATFYAIMLARMQGVGAA